MLIFESSEIKLLKTDAARFQLTILRFPVIVPYTFIRAWRLLIYFHIAFAWVHICMRGGYTYTTYRITCIATCSKIMGYITTEPCMTS